jgi:pantoate kinase
LRQTAPWPAQRETTRRQVVVEIVAVRVVAIQQVWGPLGCCLTGHDLAVSLHTVYALKTARGAAPTPVGNMAKRSHEADVVHTGGAPSGDQDWRRAFVVFHTTL